MHYCSTLAVPVGHCLGQHGLGSAMEDTGTTQIGATSTRHEAQQLAKRLEQYVESAGFRQDNLWFSSADSNVQENMVDIDSNTGARS
jgi:hypothetical protein